MLMEESVLGRFLKFRNGFKIIYFQFVPYDDVRISCLCDVEGGKVKNNKLKKNIGLIFFQDLANINIENADQLSLEEIQEIVRNKAIKIKSEKG